jgi:hypothetical protein
MTFNSTYKTDRHIVTEILLKVPFNITTQTLTLLTVIKILTPVFNDNERLVGRVCHPL